MTDLASIIPLTRGNERQERQALERLDAAASLGNLGLYETHALAALYNILGHAEHVWNGCFNMPALADLNGFVDAECSRLFRMSRMVAYELRRRSDGEEEREAVLADWCSRSGGDDDWRDK